MLLIKLDAAHQALMTHHHGIVGCQMNIAGLSKLNTSSQYHSKTVQDQISETMAYRTKQVQQLES